MGVLLGISPVKYTTTAVIELSLQGIATFKCDTRNKIL